MLPAALPSLLCCCLWALPTAVLADASFVAGATAAAAGMLAAAQARTPLRRAGLAALPAFLAAAAPAPRPAPPTPAGGPLRVEGAIARIVRTPELAGCVVHFGRGRTAVRVSFDEDVAVLPGDRVAVLASVGAAALPDMPPPLRAAAGTLRLVAPAPWPQRAAAACRRALERQLLARLPGEHGALVASLVLGRDTRPSDAVQQAHRATGLSHLLAVSGAHAAMLAWFLGAGGARGRRRLMASRARTLALVLALAAYAALVGGDAPVVRAVVAFALAALAVHLGRPCGAMPLLAAPALVTAFCAPDELLGPSFLLSYAAVAGLLLAGPTPPGGFAARWLVAPVRASLWATLLTAPLTLGFFGQLAPWTILLTPLLSPLVAVLLGGGLALGLLALFAPALADALAPGLAAAAELYLALVTAADALPGTPLPAACAPSPTLLGVAAALALAAVRTRPDRLGVAAAAALLTVPHFLPIGLRAEPGLHLAAVGHGQACVARLGDGRQVAVDCGSLQSPRLAADRLVQALARRRLDLLVITHDDADHHAGVPFLLERVHVARAVLPARLAAAPLGALLRAHGCTVAALPPGERLAPWPDVAIAAPQLPAAAPDNDHSLWVRIAFGADSALLAGDAQELGTAAALAQGLAGPATVLVLPHHGRANANAPQLLAATAPRLALASAAAADGATRLGGLLAARGVPLWSTGRDGSVWLAAAALATPQAAH